MAVTVAGNGNDKMWMGHCAYLFLFACSRANDSFDPEIDHGLIASEYFSVEAQLSKDDQLT
jgi:hypothetical protein